MKLNICIIVDTFVILHWFINFTLIINYTVIADNKNWNICSNDKMVEIKRVGLGSYILDIIAICLVKIEYEIYYKHS